MQKILVTGATGFIGNYVIDELLKHNIEIFSVQRSTKSEKVLSKKIHIIETDDLFSESIEWWETKCNGIDIVLHLAWFTKSREYLDSYENIHCLTGSLNLARAAVLAGVKRFIGIGTCVEYDLTYQTLSIDTPLKPLSIYAATKVGLFLNLTQFFKTNSVNFTWCRIFHVYGDSDDKNRFIPYLKSKLDLNEEVNLPNGVQIRDFLNVTEVARIISDLTLSGKTGPINVCSGVPKSIQEIAIQVADQFQKRDLIKFEKDNENLDSYSYIVGVPNY
jgi:nucleoside-diphosphate-sugar epimerase